MRRAAAWIGSLALAGCASAPPAAPPAPAVKSAAPSAAAPAPPPPPALRNASFETPFASDGRCAPGWDCTMHNNPGAFRFYLQDNAAAGSRSLCVERVLDEPWALVTQAFEGPAVRGARLRLSMSVLVDGVTGEGAGPWALVQGNPPINPQRLVRGTAGWQRLSVDITVPRERFILEVGATLEGPGKACFDDVRLEALPPG